MKKRLPALFLLITLTVTPAFAEFQYRIPDTGQTKCYDNEKEINFLAEELFYNGRIKEGEAGKAQQIPEYKFIANSGHDSGDFLFVRVR